MMSKVPDGCLELLAGSEVTQTFALDPTAICRIGRSSQSTIVLADNGVSRNHAMVQCTQDGEYYLSDLGSRNGTTVNQRRVTAPLLLRNGDRITIGSHELRFRGGNEPEPEPESDLDESQTVLGCLPRLITVLVTDIRDFTGLSRRLSESSLSEVISTFIRDCGTALNRNGAWAQKYIGDAVMAIWVHKTEQPEVGEMVAVFESLLHLTEVAASLQGRFGLDAPIRIGAGINTGVACIGNMGSEAASDYTALSDAVNLSFRLESATKELGCDLAVGPATFDFLQTQVAADAHFRAHTVQLKGYKESRLLYAASRGAVMALLDDLRKRVPPESQDATLSL